MLRLGKKFIFKVVTDVVLSQFKDTKKDMQKYVEKFVDERIADIKEEISKSSFSMIQKNMDVMEQYSEKRLSIIEKQIDLKVKEVLVNNLNKKEDKPKSKGKVGRPKKKK